MYPEFLQYFSTLSTINFKGLCQAGWKSKHSNENEMITFRSAESLYRKRKEKKERYVKRKMST